MQRNPRLLLGKNPNFPLITDDDQPIESVKSAKLLGVIFS